MDNDDDPFEFPWEEGAPGARPQVNFGVPSNPVRPTARKHRRSSILKQTLIDPGLDRAALQVLFDS
jgi:hypothetical protein